jgi:integrase/recombinase XerD
MLKKIYKGTPIPVWDIIDKEIIDETIFRTTKQRNRLILELMARGGMRIGEVLNLKPTDINERKLIIRDPKSGKEHEVVFIPQKIAARLKGYIEGKGIEPDQHVFPICYESARVMSEKLEKKLVLD